MEFTYKGDKFKVSECGNFVKMQHQSRGEWFGWFTLKMLNQEIQAIAKGK